MKRLRKFNDLAHVAGWLSEQTGETWEPVDVVDSCIRHGVIPHIQALAPAFADNVLPDWARDGSPVEVVFNQDLPRFLAGQGVVHWVRHNGVIFTMTPGMPASIEDLRLSEQAALQLLERMTERKAQNADRAPQSNDMPVSTEAPADGMPEGRQRRQELEILRNLKDLGYDPLRLPRCRAGTPTAKAEVRSKLPSMTPAVFKKAWERLREFGDIAEAE